MSDLRKAAEMALEVLEWINRVNAMDYEYQQKAQEPIQALRQALAQPEHEPYGYLWFTHHMEKRFTHYKPKKEQIIGEVTPIYTAPPKREWVGLTDEERADCWSSSAVQSAINIEAKLKGKNSG